jgi:putative membrane protein
MNISLLPVLHSGEGFPTGWLHSDWRPDPTVVLGVFGLMAAYVLWTGSLNRRRADYVNRPVTTSQRVMFIAGCVALLVALGQPLDDWADNYLLSAHMLQHMILLFAVAPLWLAGTPGWMLRPLTKNRIINKVGYAITRAAPALILSNAVIVFWHVPATYNAALQNEPIHILQHLTFIAAALLAWWPVLSPLPEWPRLSLPVSCLYLFLYSLPGGLVGAFIALSAPGMYAFYDNVPRIFGIPLDADQEFAGLLMWVGGSSIYLLWITRMFFRWAGQEEEKERQGGEAVPTIAQSQVRRA